MAAHFRHFVYLSIFCLSCHIAGCDAGSDRPKDQSAQRNDSLERRASSPTAAAETLNALYLKKDYESLAQLIVPEQRRSTVDLLRAIEDVVNADHELHVIAERQYHVPIPQAWGFSAIADAAGLFSRRIKILCERQTGDEARVIIQQGDDVPLIRAQFTFDGAKWLYVPDPAPQGISNRVFGVAEAIREVAQLIEGGADEDAYFHAVATKIMPQLPHIVLPQIAEESVAVAEEEP